MFSTKVGRRINKALEMLLNVLSLAQVFAWPKTSKGFKPSSDTLLKGPTLRMACGTCANQKEELEF